MAAESLMIELDPNLSHSQRVDRFSKLWQFISTERHFCDSLLHCYQYPVELKLVSRSTGKSK